MNGTIELTNENMHEHWFSGGCGINSAQLEILGMNRRPSKGWLGKLEGLEVSWILWDAVSSLRGVNSKEERQRLVSHYYARLADSSIERDGSVILTEHLIDLFLTGRAGMNKRQASVLGIGYPLRKSWKKRLIGRKIDASDYHRLIGLRGKTVASLKNKAKKSREERARNRKVGMKPSIKAEEVYTGPTRNRFMQGAN